MRVAIVPASTKTATATIRSLLARYNTVQITAWYRDTNKVPADLASHPHIDVRKGDVLDASSLDFTGCDAVLTIPPPFFTEERQVALSEEMARNVKNAIDKAGTVKRLVMISSIGAHLYEGVGEIKTKTAAERILKQTNVPNITIMRPGFFMDNWIMQLPELMGLEPVLTTTLTPQTRNLAMVSVKDIGAAAAKDLTTVSKGSEQLYTYELHGPKREGYSTLDVRDAFSKSLRKYIAVKEIAPDQLHSFLSAIYPPGCVGEKEEMVKSFLQGGALEVYPDPQANVVYGETSLEAVIDGAVRAARTAAIIGAT